MWIYRCDQCQAIYIACQDICEHCESKNSMLVHEIAGEGEIITYTIIHRGARYLTEPYMLAVIQLVEGYQVLARIESGLEIGIGQLVKYLRNDEYGSIFVP